MPLFPISSFQAAQSGEQNVKIKKNEITVTPEQGGGGGSGVVVEASSNTTVNGYQVPSLTDEQLVAIYNAVVAGKPVTVTDATGTMHFSSLNADSVSGDIYVTILYFDKMILEYSEGNIDYKEIGAGGGIQMELLWENATPTSSFANQNIEFPDMLDYSEIIIEYIYSTNGHSPKRNTVDLSHFRTCTSLDTLLSIQGNWKSINMRPVSCWKTSDSGNPIISFESGMNLNLQSIPPVGSKPTSSNIGCIPTKIYGVK